MNETQDRRARARELRADAMDDVARRAEKGFADTRFDGWRSRGRRRGVIVTWALLVVAIAGVTLLDEPLVTIGSFAVGGAATWFLRVLVRAVPDLPEEVLDERQVVRRDRAYRTAYQVVVAVALVTTLAMYIAADGTRPEYDILPSHVNALFMVILFGALGLPSAVYGWSEQEV